MTIDVLMMDAFLRFFQFLVNNMVAYGRRFWWIWESENYENEMTLKNDFSFTCFPIAFLRFDMVWTILNASLTSEFCGLEVILINVLKSFVKLKIQCLNLARHVICVDGMHSHVGQKK